MNTKGLIDQLLASGQSLLNPQAGAARAAGQGSSNFLTSDFSKGALAGGALGLLLGNKGLHKLGGGALKYGSAAALGAPTVGIYCASDPFLTGLYGAARATNLGAPGKPPDVAEVLESFG